MLNTYAEIVGWVSTQKSNVKEKYKYNEPAINEFMKENNTDTWLIAFAKTYNYIIVTNESLNPYIKKKIPIPNVCKHFNIQYVNIFEMLRKLNFKI